MSTLLLVRVCIRVRVGFYASVFVVFVSYPDPALVGVWVRAFRKQSTTVKWNAYSLGGRVVETCFVHYLLCEGVCRIEINAVGNERRGVFRFVPARYYTNRGGTKSNATFPDLLAAPAATH